MKYIDAEKLKAEIQRRSMHDREAITADEPKYRTHYKLGRYEGLRDLIDMIDSLQQDETQVDKMLSSQIWWEEQGWIMIPPDATIEGIDSLLREVKKKLQQEQSKERLIQVKCISPYDESWEENKIYVCEVWHHSDLNKDFWDVYYDYGNNPKYVQFSSIKMLNEEFAIVKQEQPEVDLEEAARHVYESWMGGHNG